VSGNHDERVLVFALFGGDAVLTRDILATAHVETHVCADVESLAHAIAEGAAAVIVAEEALVPSVADRLVGALDGQPSWSDLPVIVSVTERDCASELPLGSRVNVIALERPVRIDALINTVHSALRARRRQYETRDLLHSLECLTVRTRLLAHASELLSSARTAGEVAAVALTQGLEVAGAPRGLIGVLGDRDAALDVILMRGFSDETTAAWRRVPMTTAGPVTDVVRKGEAAFYARTNDITQQYPHLGPSRGDSALCVLPLATGGRTFGVMTLVYDEPRSFTDEQRAELLSLARVCAQAMDRALLFELAQCERVRAEEANRAKDEFLAVVSHELRTPLTSMLGWTRMLRARALDESQREKALETIERNAVAQTQLIEDLLDVTRITTGKMRLQIGPVRLGQVIEAAVETVKPAAHAKGVAIQTELTPVAHLAGDAERLQQAVWNLLSNAVKFTPRGGCVSVALRTAGANVEVVVQDSGAGIAPEFLPHIFERFRQADASTTRTHGGLGLGLAIVKHLVELHGGTVDATSMGDGRGTTFTMRLPFVAAHSLTLPTLRASTHGRASNLESREDVPQVEGLRVLVVEDEPDSRNLLVALLEQRDVVVQTASSAAEALARLSTWRPDVILSDVGMPVEDGYSFIQKVRSLPQEQGGGTPAVALTAYARTEDRRKAMLAGFNIHMAKPIDVSELLVVIANLGGRSPPAARSATIS
jgi:signal transduction histidine kinase/CheY-like chemotaxis protein